MIVENDLSTGILSQKKLKAMFSKLPNSAFIDSLSDVSGYLSIVWYKGLKSSSSCRCSNAKGVFHAKTPIVLQLRPAALPPNSIRLIDFCTSISPDAG